MKQVIVLLITFLFTIPVFSNCPYSDKKFDTVDKNGDKKISKEEWTEKFNRIDKNKDGSISENEMNEHHKEYQKEKK